MNFNEQQINAKPEKDPGIEIRRLLQGITDILEQNEPSDWWKNIYRFLKSQQSALEQLPQSLRDDIENTFAQVFDLLEEEKRQPHASTHEEERRAAYQADRAKHVMYAIADLLTKSEDHEKEPIEVKYISMDDILARPEFELEITNDENGEEHRMLKIQHPETGEWYDFPIPARDDMWHKGGCSRVVLKILAGAPKETIAVELPPNDIDVITTAPPKEAYAEADRMGVDLKSVELLKTADWPTLFRSRDVGVNASFLGRDGLLYWQQGFEEARTGNMVLHGDNPGIYGSHTFEFEGARLAKSGGMARLLKTLCEKKAVSFDFLPVNEQIDLGTMWLYLAGRKFINKPNRAELLDRLYEAGKRMGQVRDDEKDVYAVLDRVHSENPKYSVIEAKLDKLYLVRWLQEKLAATVEQRFREKHGLGSGMNFVRKPEDMIPYRVHLDEYVADPEKLRRIEDG